jgi:hypothetical protein
MKLKLTAKEWGELETYTLPGRNGFENLMGQLRYRANQDSGEVELDDEDFRKLHLYANRRRKRKIAAVFGRPLKGIVTFLE